jgi:hypothetical protein
MEGLDKFREAFADFTDNYVIIGGTACGITMTNTAMRPRSTHDIDMIVIVEKMTSAYAERFWQFIREANYRSEKRKQDVRRPPKYEMYRFLDGKPGYPKMIELLSRHQDILGEPRGLLIEPIPTDDDISSLSAIIMDEDYYHFTVAHSLLTDGIRHADSAALIALKTRAYLNLIMEKSDGKHVNTKDIKKHRSDVLKNVFILEDAEVIAPLSIVNCVKEFVSSIINDWETLAYPLSKSIGRDTDFVRELLNRLNYIFIAEK